MLNFRKKVIFSAYDKCYDRRNRHKHDINEDLASLTKHFGIALEVGSQKVALNDDELKKTFTVLKRSLNEKNIVVSNLSANSSLEDVMKSISMINADAISLHLNPAQEL